MLVKGSDHISGLLWRTRIVDHKIGPLYLVGLRPLRRNSPAGLFLAETIPETQSLQLNLRFDKDHQDLIDTPLSASLEQQRRLVNDQTQGGPSQRCKAALGQVCDSRVGDFFEPKTGRRICEHLLREGLPIEAALFRQDSLAKDIDQLLQYRAAGIDDFPGQHVGADHCGTQFSKATGNGTFPRSNPTCKSENHVTPSSMTETTDKHCNRIGTRADFTEY